MPTWMCPKPSPATQTDGRPHDTAAADAPAFFQVPPLPLSGLSESKTSEPGPNSARQNDLTGQEIVPPGSTCDPYPGVGLTRFQSAIPPVGFSDEKIVGSGPLKSGLTVPTAMQNDVVRHVIGPIPVAWTNVADGCHAPAPPVGLVEVKMV